METNIYGSIDNYFGELLPKVLSVLEANEIPNFSNDQLEELKLAIKHMIKRTPDLIPDHNDKQLGKRCLEETLAILDSKKDAAEVQKYQKQLNDDLEQIRLGRDIRVRATFQPSPRIDEALENLSVRWAVNDPDNSFILARKMIYFLGNGGSNVLENPDVQIRFPISPKYCLILINDEHHQIPHINIQNSTQTKELNKYAMSQSNQIASHSKDLLISLIKNK